MAQQETSALFSLKELMVLEEDRIRQEKELRRKQAEDAERARLKAEASARERDLARRRFEEQRRLEAETRKREEEARLEAIRAAEIERARIEAMERVRGDELSAARAHAERLAALAGGESKKRLRKSLWTVSLGCAAIVALGTALYFGKIKPGAEDSARALQALADAKQAAMELMQREVNDQNDKLRDLENRIEAEREAAKRATSREPRPSVVKPSPVHPKAPPAKATPCTCEPHDPMCGCFAPR